MSENPHSRCLRFDSLDAVKAGHKSGFAVRHDCTPLLVSTESIPVEDRFYYTWHSSKAKAHAELKRFGFVGESCIIPIEETEAYRRTRRAISALQRAKKRSRIWTSGGSPGGQSSSSA